MNAQDYWLANPQIRATLPPGYMREAWDRWRAQLGELPPEVLAQYASGESVDYAEAGSTGAVGEQHIATATIRTRCHK